jgi:DNA ligase-1
LTYSTCPAWRNQGGAPVNARSCKHLRAILGDAYEDARILMKTPNADLGKSGKGKAAAKKKPASKKKKADGDEDDEEDDDDAGGKVKVELLLATKWDLETGTDPKGWWMSEKLDGVRYVLSWLIRPSQDLELIRNDLSSTYWDGTRMLSRLGNPFTPPQWLTDSKLFWL